MEMEFRGQMKFNVDSCMELTEKTRECYKPRKHECVSESVEEHKKTDMYLKFRNAENRKKAEVEDSILEGGNPSIREL